MKSFEKFYSDNDFANFTFPLEERFLGSLKTASNSAMKNLSKKSKKLGPGKSSSMRIRIPKSLSEAKEQVGSRGGVLAEYQFLLSLYNILQDGGVDCSLKDQGKIYNGTQFLSGPYKESLESYREQERGTKKKAERTWISHGIKGAEHVSTRLWDNIDGIQQYSFVLEATGVALTGKEKSDVIIHYTKKSAKELSSMIKMSLKTSEEGSPLSEAGFHEGLQTSWKHYLLSLLTGLSANDIKRTESTETDVQKGIEKSAKKLERSARAAVKAESIYDASLETLELAMGDLQQYENKYRQWKGFSKLENDLDALDEYNPTDAQIESALKEIPKKIKELEVLVFKSKTKVDKYTKAFDKGYAAYHEAMKSYNDSVVEYNNSIAEYKNTVDYKLTELGKSVGMCTDLAQEINNYAEMFKEYQLTPKSVRETKIDWVKSKRVDYFKLIKVILDSKMKNPKISKEIISNVMKLSGIESSLDYLTLGSSKVVTQKKKNTRYLSRSEENYLASRAASTLFDHKYKSMLNSLAYEDLTAKTVSEDDLLAFYIYRSSMSKPFIKIELKVGFNNGRIGLPKFLVENEVDYKKLTTVYANENPKDVIDLEKKLAEASINIKEMAEQDKVLIAAKKKAEKKPQGASRKTAN